MCVFCLSVCLSVCVCLSIRLSVSVCPSVCLCPSVRPSVCLSVCLSLSVCLCLSVCLKHLILQLICLRYHFIVTTLEAEFLTRLYKKQLISLESEECHAHLRFIIFDQTVRFPPDKDLDYFVSRNREDIKGGNARLDRYARTKLRLAIHELDEHHVGEFSFKTFQDIMKV